MYNTQENVRRACIGALNSAVLRKYKHGSSTNSIGAVTYKNTNSPWDIIDGLRSKYGKPTPQEKEENERQINLSWNPSEPVENLFDQLEECYVVALIVKPAYTMDQMIDEALTAIQKTGLYSLAILEWNGFNAPHKTWPEFKAHFSKAYKIWLASSGGTAGQHGYHGAHNTENEENDDDSWQSVHEGIINQLSQVQMANNAVVQATNETISALTANVSQLSAQLAAMQQQLAAMTTAPPPPQAMAAHTHLTTIPSPVPHIVAPQTYTAPTYTTGTPGQSTGRWNGGGRGRGRGGGRSGGRTRGGRNTGAYGGRWQQPMQQPSGQYGGGQIALPPPNTYLNQWGRAAP